MCPANEFFESSRRKRRSKLGNHGVSSRFIKDLEANIAQCKTLHHKTVAQLNEWKNGLSTRSMSCTTS